MRSFVEVYVARDPAEAHMLKAYLGAAGIPARVVGEMLRIGLGDFPMGWPSAPRILAPRDRAREARLLLLRLEEIRSVPVAGVGWTCPACGEEVEAQFELCWSCLQPKPSYLDFDPEKLWP